MNSIRIFTKFLLIYFILSYKYNKIIMLLYYNNITNRKLCSIRN